MYPSVVELNAKISTYLYSNLLKDKREIKIRNHLKFHFSFISIEDYPYMCILYDGYTTTEIVH